jgi:hypothetical protein
MKNAYLIFFVFIVFISGIYSCKEEKCEDPNSINPVFSEEDLEWVKFKDTVVYFKYTSADTVDTIMGTYSNYRLKKISIPDDRICGQKTYYEATVDFKTNAWKKFHINYDYIIELKNYPYPEYRIYYMGSFSFNKKMVFDSLKINNKAYEQVIKFPDEGYQKKYIAKGIGIIYISNFDYPFKTIELITN